ncbi:GntR family transcriptional regulator [Caballeronia pedi]|uniref:GntR family transcriptional regulator n=1 Tax=Caballeronia pedi TaxID=1777141 RepID=A0A158DD22_9BURK|nr:GntR family transcriptional regulator [Caballeronia pedi]SAK92146.1 GntR family transcriptional regulator [Caballeronia pedi]
MRALDQIAFEVPKSLAEMTEERLRQTILKGDLEFGEQITEAGLSELFGLSKTPVREALVRLSVRERLVEIKPRSGTFVFSLKEKDISDISALRITLEQAAIRAAMTRDRGSLIAELSRHVDGLRVLRETIDLATYRALDHEFHAIFLRHSDNPYLVDCYTMISTKVLAMRNRLTFSREYVIKSIDEHFAIAHALSAGDVDGACDIVAEHINSGFTARTRRLLADISPGR